MAHQGERELRRKDKALAGTAALLVLSKKVAAIFRTGEDKLSAFLGHMHFDSVPLRPIAHETGDVC